jgi:Phage integrase, N-terminal SAM-like domain/Phage integrase family
MGMLRERMAVDLRLRGFSPVTQRMYLGCAQRFAADHHQPPTALGEAEVRTFLDHLVRERRISRAALGVYVAALHFLYRVTLDRPDVVQRIRYPRRGRERFPEILSPAEVERLLGAGRSLKHRAMVMVAYGAGLRASELCALTAADIDSERMLLRVRAGKGDKDRDVMLSPRLLDTLRAYWRQRPPRGPYLFSPPRHRGAAAVPQSALARPAPGGAAGAAPQTRDAPRLAPQLRHPSAPRLHTAVLAHPRPAPHRDRPHRLPALPPAHPGAAAPAAPARARAPMTTAPRRTAARLLTGGTHRVAVVHPVAATNHVRVTARARGPHDDRSAYRVDGARRAQPRPRGPASPHPVSSARPSFPIERTAPPPDAPLNAGLPPPRARPSRPRLGQAARSAAANRLLVPSPFAKRAFMSPMSIHIPVHSHPLTDQPALG